MTCKRIPRPLLYAALFASLLVTPVEAATLRAITIGDLARVGTVGDSKSAILTHGTQVPAAPSPNGQHVAVVLRQGNPEAGSVDGKLLIYEERTLFSNVRPRTVAQLSSRSLYEPITKLNWLPDSRHLMFMGSKGESPPQIFSVDSITGKLRQLTKFASPVYDFAATSDGATVVVVHRPPQLPLAGQPDCVRSGCVIPDADIGAIDLGFGKKTDIEIFDTRKGESRKIAALEELVPNVEICETTLEGPISPDGTHALIECRSKDWKWPAWWHDYTGDPELPNYLGHGNNLYSELLVLLDLRTGKAALVNGAPYFNNGTAPIWVDNSHFLIAGQFEALDGVSGDERAHRVAHRELLLVSADDRTVRRLADMPANVSRYSGADWDSQRQVLTLSERTPDGKIIKVGYRRAGERWEEISSLPEVTKSSEKISFSLKQSPNDPPVLVATDRVSGRSRTILDPNPWLKARKLGEVQAVSWIARDGHHWNADLYLPPAYMPGERYPLVIQTHGFANELFSLSGTGGVNFLGQALAADNIVVLQIGHFDVPLGGKEEFPGVQAGFEAAVDYLDDRKLVQRDKVAIQGYSRTGPHVAYTMTHSTYRFAAAALTSTLDYGWLGYLAVPSVRTDMVSLIGGNPFGAGLQKWADEVSSFHLDAVKTPMFLSNEGDAWGLWDWFAGLKILGKPVEYLLIPKGAHGVLTVPQQMKLNGMLKDWYRFWLQGYEDPDPAKAEQYHRWRSFCDASTGQDGKAGLPNCTVPAVH